MMRAFPPGVVCGAVLLISGMAAFVTAAQGQPFPLDLAGARIEEGAIRRGASIPDRDFRIVFLLHDPALCDASRDGLTYTLLIDADRRAGSGRVLPQFPGLGIDTQVPVRCSGADGRFVSAFGDVANAPAAEGLPPRLILATRLSRLPGPEFLFVALVTHGDRFIAAPESRRPVYFGILERRLW